MKLVIAALALAAVSGCAQQITPGIEIGPSPVFSPPSNADVGPKSTRRDIILDRNFVSLRLDFSGGVMGVNRTMTIGRKSLTATNPTGDEKLPTRTVPLSDDERKKLLELLNDIDFVKLVGKYDDLNLDDGFRNVVTLTTTNYGKTDVYVVDVYGNSAPKDFTKLTAFLNELQTRKFATQ